MSEPGAPVAQPQTLVQMGPTVRGQIWPTFPRQSTAPGTWSVVKYYVARLGAADTDNILNTAANRKVRFDLPITVLGWNATVTISDGSGFPVGWDPLSCFGVKFSTVGGENITLESVRGSNVCGTGRRPGFSWGGGWPFGPGSELIVDITPRLPGLAEEVTLDIELVFPCLQTRIGSSNHAVAVQNAQAGGGPSGGVV